MNDRMYESAKRLTDAYWTYLTSIRHGDARAAMRSLLGAAHDVVIEVEAHEYNAKIHASFERKP